MRATNPLPIHSCLASLGAGSSLLPYRPNRAQVDRLLPRGVRETLDREFYLGGRQAREQLHSPDQRGDPEKSNEPVQFTTLRSLKTEYDEGKVKNDECEAILTPLVRAAETVIESCRGMLEQYEEVEEDSSSTNILEKLTDCLARAAKLNVTSEEVEGVRIVRDALQVSEN